MFVKFNELEREEEKGSKEDYVVVEIGKGLCSYLMGILFVGWDGWSGSVCWDILFYVEEQDK